MSGVLFNFSVKYNDYASFSYPKTPHAPNNETDVKRILRHSLIFAIRVINQTLCLSSLLDYDIQKACPKNAYPDS